MRSYPSASGAESNNMVANPGTGGVVQRRARPRPNDCTLPAAASESSARCTVRGLTPSASESAELDHDSPSARKASTAACRSSTGRASTTTSPARRGASANPRFVALTPASVRSAPRSRPTSTRNRARCDSSANFPPNARASSAPLGTSSGQASPSARASANNTGRLASEITVCASRTTWRHASTTSAFDSSNASTSSSRRRRSSPRAIRRVAGVLRTRDALSTSAVSAGMPAMRATRSARASAARAVFVRRRRIAIPATVSSWAALDADGKGAGSSAASLRSASSRRPIRRRRRISRCRACAALTRSPCASSVARAASSAFAGQLRSRETSAISASATTHRARATASFGPKARAALRRRAFARTRSPSCAIAMPRSASAGGSSRRATRFSAPRASPAASARAAAVISESIGIPPHLSLPPFAARYSFGSRSPTPRERRTMTRHKTGTREEWLKARLELLAAEKELTRRSDALARRRQELPWVRVDKEYRFETDEGSASLADLFQGRSQLLVYHFMFGPDYTAGCPSCSAIADGFDGFAVHLANHDVMLWAVSRAPLAKLQAYKRRMGWSFPWASSAGSDFNFDFDVAFTEAQQRAGGVEYNYRRGGHAMDAAPVPEPVARFAASCGTDAAGFSRDRPGMSAFVFEDGAVYHTYSTYARGL